MSKKNSFWSSHHRYEIYPAAFIFNLISLKKNLIVIIKNKRVHISLRSYKYKIFMENPRCSTCGLHGTYFALEKSEPNSNKPCLHLYGRREDGKEIMFTKDHTIPKSKGGKSNLSNLVSMCLYCNQLKADKIILSAE